MIAAAPLALVVAWTALLVWLNARQIGHLQTLERREPPAGTDAGARSTAIAVTLARTRLAIAGTLAEAAVLAVLLGGGIAGLARACAGLPPVAAAVLLVLAVVGLRGAVRLAVQAVATFGVDTRFGLNRASPRLFLADAGKRAALALAFGLPVLAAVAALMAGGRPWWWLAAWAAWAVGLVVRVAVQPVIVARVVNTSTPLADTALARRLAGVLAGCGLRLAEVRVLDASRRSRRANAGLFGLGRARRVLLHDTLLERLDGDEVAAVVAHEAGHAHHRHIAQYLAASALVGLGAFALLQAFGPAAGAGVGERLAAFVLLLPLAGLFVRPLAAAALRRWEYQADAFAAAAVGAWPLARALDKLYAANANAPSGDPLHAAFHATHPEPDQRLRRLRSRP